MCCFITTSCISLFLQLALLIRSRVENSENVVYIRRGRCHGVALWMEYRLTDDITVSMGLTQPASEEVFHAILTFTLAVFLCSCARKSVGFNTLFLSSGSVCVESTPETGSVLLTRAMGKHRRRRGERDLQHNL